MKNVMKVAAVAAALFAMVISGQSQITNVVVYEDGTGYYTEVGGINHQLTGQMLPDPSFSGLPGNVLIFTLPFNFQQQGEYDILETGSSSELSDVARFFGNNQLIFYSEIDAGEQNPPLADTGLPQNQWLPAYGANELTLPPNTPEAPVAWFTVTPNLGGPGYVEGVGVTYTFVSEVPEPTTGALVIMFLAIGYFGRRLAFKRE